MRTGPATWALLLVGLAACAGPGRPSPSAGPAALALVDARSRLAPEYTIEELRGALREAGVRRVILTGPWDARVAAAARRYPGEVAACYGLALAGQMADVWGQRPEVIEGLVAFVRLGLRAREASCIGEAQGRAPAAPAEGLPPTAVPADGPLLLRLAEVADEAGVPLLIRHDPAAHPEELRRLLRHRPGLRLILVGGGGLAARGLRGWLGSHPNLWLALAAPDLDGPRDGEAPFSRDGELAPAWRDLFEAHRERIILGLAIARRAHLAQARARADGLRLLLAQVSPEAARRLAGQNADHLFPGK
jgi:hypothetical protein